MAVSATGLAHVPGRPENIAYMTMFFDGSLIAHVHVNWLSPVKVRRTLLGGSRRMVVFDDLEASEKIKVYDRGISLNPSPENVYQMLIGYRTGDMWAPQLAVTEALSVEAAHFVDVRAPAAPRPLTDGEAGLRVVRLLEAATESMAASGPPRSSLRERRRTHDSVRRPAGAVPRAQARDRRRRPAACSSRRSSSSARRSRRSRQDFAAYCQHAPRRSA